MESNTALWRATMARRYSQRVMCRLGAAVVLRSACTPAAVTLLQRLMTWMPLRMVGAQ